MLEASQFITDTVEHAINLPQRMLTTVVVTKHSNTKGMHTLIDFNLSTSNISNINLNASSIYRMDILVVFIIPNSAYIDLHELEVL
jgi:hypothetical protein